jgi:hypothetical protein
MTIFNVNLIINKGANTVAKIKETPKYITRRSDAMTSHLKNGVSYTVAIDKARQALAKASQRHSKHNNECIVTTVNFNVFENDGKKVVKRGIVIGRIASTTIGNLPKSNYILVYCETTRTCRLMESKDLFNGEARLLNYNEHCHLNNRAYDWLNNSALQGLERWTFASLIDVRLIKGQALPIQRHAPLI